ncbi:MAE_28990/MAE_18760 family HEPN-like nuclease [Aeromonas molluscorum]|uniref:MAE_28990/MAE_18760 family HEPN-like nuclease n=1 Tax=Aeromonas molluscorum TaxID=271417 RepID=UPI003F198ED8
MKVRSAGELEEKLDEDLVWRKREFTTLKLMINSSRNHEKQVLLRAAIALLYSHWEGHIKFCAQTYICYLNALGLSYHTMTDNFLQLSLGERFGTGFSIKKFPSQRDVFEYIKKEQRESFSINADIVIDTQSNLKYEVIFNILEQLGLNSSAFELKENFINSRLLKCRNQIAHGDRCNQRELEETYEELENELLSMIMIFHNMIRNAVVNKEYLKKPLE